VTKSTAGHGSCHIIVRDQILQMLPERGLFWRDRRILFVADLHLGKDATFRQAGLAVPAVSSRDSLDRLRQLVETVEPNECVILGDLIHAADSLNERVHAEVSDFFARVVGCKWRLIQGNHDRHTKKWPEHWPLVIESAGCIEGPFQLLHIPPAEPEPIAELKKGSDFLTTAEPFFLAGHIHPAWRGTGSILVREKLPCFWMSRFGLVLPAFGTFTGTKQIDRSKRERVFVIADSQVIEV
jgi:DNA ligase-associated metallophosphoesterase